MTKNNEPSKIIIKNIRDDEGGQTLELHHADQLDAFIALITGAGVVAKQFDMSRHDEMAAFSKVLDFMDSDDFNAKVEKLQEEDEQ